MNLKDFLDFNDTKIVDEHGATIVCDTPGAFRKTIDELPPGNFTAVRSDGKIWPFRIEPEPEPVIPDIDDDEEFINAPDEIKRFEQYERRERERSQSFYSAMLTMQQQNYQQMIAMMYKNEENLDNRLRVILSEARASGGQEISPGQSGGMGNSLVEIIATVLRALGDQGKLPAGMIIPPAGGE